MLVVTRRGAGKGNFFSTLQDAGEKGFLDELLSAIAGDDHPKWQGVAFFNLSFTHEVMSVFDRVSEFLHDRLVALLRDDDLRPLKAGWGSLENDRLGRLNFILSAWAQRPSGSQRVLIAINTFEILFDEQGSPKNGETKQIFNALVRRGVAAAPIDFLLVMDEHRVPPVLLRTAEHSLGTPGRDLRLPSPCFLLPSPIDEKRRNRENARWVRLSDTANKGPNPDEFVRNYVALRNEDNADVARVGATAVHFLREDRAAFLAAAYFPRVALLIARSILIKSYHDDLCPKINNGKYPSIYFEDDNAVDFRQKIREILQRELLKSERPDRGLSLRDFVPIATVYLAIALEHQDLTPPEELLVKLANELRKAGGTEAYAVATDLLVNNYSKGSGGGSFDKAIFEAAVKAYDDRMRRIYETAGGSRFAITLLFTGAYEITTELTWTRPDCQTIPISDVEEVMGRVDRFLDRVGYTSQGLAERNRTGAIIEQVVRLISRHHARGASLPLRLNLTYDPSKRTRGDTRLPGGWPKPTDKNPSNPQMLDLLMEIIWHLAIIGQPVELEVLVSCPLIQRSAIALFESKRAKISRPSSQKPSEITAIQEKMVAEILALGVNRCLIFPIKPAARDEPPEVDPIAGTTAGAGFTRSYPPPRGDNASRYTVHRLMQRYVFSQMGAPDFEYSERDQFTVSLFASQPNDLPRLSPHAHNRIRYTIATLAGYPDGRSEPQSKSSEDDIQRQVRMLRAAYGIMRSVYSVGVLARFDPRSDPSMPGTPDIGHFEDYRRLVLWVLKAAVDLEDKYNDVIKLKEDATSKFVPPFYSEEVVWLYNECGVLSLVQGQLADAHMLFGRALAAAERNEPDETRPLRLRIGLNKAIVDIERGYPAEARRALQLILALSDYEDSVLPLLARGHLGLIEHLAGNIDVSKKYYRQAIKNLITKDQSRAASIFLRHRSDLFRIIGDKERAEKDVMQSLNFAQEGCHEDIRHLALLSRAKLLIKNEPGNGRLIYADLDEAERYAGVVGMPRLSCEATELRARLLLTQGETRLASSLAARTLEIAATHDLRLRKMNALLLLAEICKRRGEPRAASPLIELGRGIAKAAGAHFALTEIQRSESELASDRAS